MGILTVTIGYVLLLSLKTVFCSNEYRQETFDNGNFKVSWRYNETTGYLNFHLEVKTTGWVGFGFALTAPNAMQNYDVVIGGVTDNGTSYFDDYFTRGYQRPPKDSSQDYNLINASEYNGWTKLSFKRLADTGDDRDIKISAGLKVHLVYAYSALNDADTTFTIHNIRGFSKQVEIIPPLPGTTSPSITSIKEYQNQVIQFDGGNFNVTWTYDRYKETLTFLLRVRTTGWVGFGFAPKAPNSMRGYDVAVGGVNSNGSSYFQDYFTTGFGRPPPDVSQDYRLINASESDEVTSIYFYRKRFTNDSNDMQFEDGTAAYLVWAYHSNSDMFVKHTNRGASREAFVIVTGIPKTTPLPVTEAGNFTAPMKNITPSTMKPIMFDNKMAFDEGRFKVYWTYNNSTDMLNFKLEVKTKGWVSFGFTTTPLGMENYDIAIGWIDENGKAYLKDYFTRGTRSPIMDSRFQQDFKLGYFKEENGTTTLQFNRKRDTNDLNDLKIQKGMEVYLVWAYGTDDNLAYHGRTRGYSRKVALVPDLTQAPVTNTTALPGKTIVFENQMTFDSGRFKVYWTYINSTDMLHFKLKVKTKGWVSFGFTKTPYRMISYDLAIGWVDANGKADLKDCFTYRTGPPQVDTRQNFQPEYFKEENGTTMLQFYRKRDTNDINDLRLQKGMEVYLVWAYGTDDNLAYHGRTRGHSRKVALVPDPKPAQMVFDEGRFKVYWTYNTSTDILNFKLEVKTKGWVSFGFTTTPARMNYYDVAVGWNDANGTAYLKDYYTVGTGPPKKDLQQDFKLEYFKEKNGTTVLQFYRKRDTNDIYDLKIQKGMKVYLVWAYGMDDKLAYHLQNRGYSERIVLIPAAPATAKIRTTLKTATPPARANKPKPTTQPYNLVIQKMMFNDGMFQVYYAYDNRTDRLHFKLEVMTQGWVSFGFTTNPRRMENYDLAIGGLNSNGTIYLKDYITIGQTTPREDTQQDFKLVYANVGSGKTTLQFYRKRDTMSTEDLSFKDPSEQFYFVWAYGSVGALGYHGQSTRGYSDKLSTAALLGMESKPTTTTVTQAPENQGNSGNQVGSNVFDKPTRDMLVILVATTVGLSGAAVVLLFIVLVLINRKRAEMEFKITDSRM